MLRGPLCCRGQVKSLEKFTALRSLCVHGHALTAIEGLQSLGQLTDLNLSGNAITSMAGLERLGALQYLNLSRNQLTTTAGLSQCVRLQRLVLSCNQIASLGGLGDLGPYAPQLSVIDLRANQLGAVAELQHLAGCVVDHAPANACQADPHPFPLRGRFLRRSVVPGGVGRRP